MGFLALAAVVKKNVVDANKEFFVDVPIEYQTVGSKNYNFTLRKEIPGNWVSAKSS